MTARREQAVEIGGRRLTVSNLDKVLYPAAGFTKRDVIDYYVRVAPVLLPHLRDRPLTLKRYPNGVDGPFFYEKRCPAHRPPWIRTEPVWSEGNQDVIRFCVVDDVAALVWLGNLADLELHTYLHRVPEVERPTLLVFDLDPGAPADAIQCCEVALLLRGLFERLGLAAFPKTSGSKGVQVYVPLNTPVTYQDTKAFARAVAEQLEAQRPELVVSSMKKALRVGKVLVDWSQNDVHKTTVCVWSLRARERPTVSTPLAWREVEEVARTRDARRIVFDAATALGRMETAGDLFAPVLTLRQHLPRPDAARPERRGAARIAPGGAASPPPSGVDRRSTRAQPGSAGVRRQPRAPAAPPREPRAPGRPHAPRPPPRGAARPERGQPGDDGYFSSE